MNHLAVALVLSAVATFAEKYTIEKKPVPVEIPRACYTEEARQARVEGDVLLNADIYPDGLPHSIRLKRSLEPGLDASAIETVKQWRFKPGEKHGQPVIAPVSIIVNFRLSDPTQRCVTAAGRGEDQHGREQ